MCGCVCVEGESYTSTFAQMQVNIISTDFPFMKKSDMIIRGILGFRFPAEIDQFYLVSFCQTACDVTSILDSLLTHQWIKIDIKQNIAKPSYFSIDPICKLGHLPPSTQQ